MRLTQLWTRTFFAAIALGLIAIVVSPAGPTAARVASLLMSTISIVAGAGGILAILTLGSTRARDARMKRDESRPRAKEPDSPSEVVADAFRPLINAGGARDLAVAVVIGGEPVICTFPTRAGENLENRLYEIGSLTKPITGEILAAMVADGRVSLETQIGALIPGAKLSADVGSITLEQLATHRSGLRRLPRSRRLAFRGLLGFDPYGWITPPILVRFLERAKRTAPAGTYSNFGFGVLGFALGAKHGGGYAKAFQDCIGDRLSLTDTHLDPVGSLAVRLGSGHDLVGMRMPTWKMNAMAGGGGLCMTIGDGARWLSAHLRPTGGFENILNTATLVRAKAGTDGVGFGWLSRTTDDSTIVWHNGGTGGFGSFAAFDRARDVGIIVFTATAHTNALDRAAFAALRQCSDRWGRTTHSVEGNR